VCAEVNLKSAAAYRGDKGKEMLYIEWRNQDDSERGYVKHPVITGEYICCNNRTVMSQLVDALLQLDEKNEYIVVDR
jgi:hypothetical protein